MTGKLSGATEVFGQLVLQTSWSVNGARVIPSPRPNDLSHPVWARSPIGKSADSVSVGASDTALRFPIFDSACVTSHRQTVEPGYAKQPLYADPGAQDAPVLEPLVPGT